MTLVAAAIGVAAMMLVAGTANAADPTGRYENGRLKATLKKNPLGAERISIGGGTVKVRRRGVTATFVDIPRDRSFRLTMRLTARLQNVDDQIATVASGDVLMRDLVSGAPIASEGVYTHGRFRIFRKDDPGRTWIIKQDQKLKVREISGVLTGLTKGKLKADR